jgi:hypothetical protein
MNSTALTIRTAHPADEAAIRRLAALDSARPPGGEILLAEEDGELRAALSTRDGRAVADPFHLTDPLVEMLRARSRRVGGEVVLRARPAARGLRAALR